MKSPGATTQIRWRSSASEWLRRVRRFVRRGGKVVWWAVTLQLPRRLRVRRAQRTLDRRLTQPGIPPNVHDAVRRFTKPGPDFEEVDSAAGGGVRARAFAYYLPQFHTNAQNDEFWGRGFTEWRNVVRGAPRFAGHYQPRIPRDLGYYDLGDPEVLRRQAQMARAAGIEGFGFYYYRFASGRVLGVPVEHLLADSSIDLPFFLIWANENWTRTWDGLDREVLLEQTYGPGLEAELIPDLARHFADPRYLRIDGRPLFMVYRPGHIPHLRQSVDRWRSRFDSEFGERPLIIMAHSEDADDPRAYGLDGAAEFPPHRIGGASPDLSRSITILDPRFVGQVRDYRRMAAAAQRPQSPGYPLIRTVAPSWDNDARRPGRGMTYLGSSPAVYRAWLDEAIEFANRHPFHGEPLVFVNAWNEWAEGAYLEPDVHYGAAYLNATSRALHGTPEPGGVTRILLVGHDAHRNGAQLLLLHLGMTLARRFGVEVSFLLLEGGDLVAEYQRVAPLTVLGESPIPLARHLEDLRHRGYTEAITNTVVSGSAIPALKASGFHVVSLVHEMPGIIADRGWTEPATLVAESADAIVLPSPLAAAGFQSLHSELRSLVVTRPQGLYQDIGDAGGIAPARNALRTLRGWGEHTTVVLGVGFGDHRKGMDLFVATARLAGRDGVDMQFVWVGEVDGGLTAWLGGSSAPANLIQIPFTTDIAAWYAAADVLLVTSREDPYPSTVLEATAAGLPTVAFRGRIGSEPIVARHGALVDELDPAAVVSVLRRFGPLSPDQRRERVEAQQDAVLRDHRFDEYAFDLLRIGEPSLRRVSVVVPNYNYSRYLERRLASIFDQTHPVFEVIVVDDASTDDSVRVVTDTARSHNRDVTVITNPSNSGAIIGQWHRGVAAARGEFVWIAEADDDADRGFLSTLMARVGERTVLGFTDSRVIDSRGHQSSASYRDYYATVSGGQRLLEDFEAEGVEVASSTLAVENMMLNVSAAVMRRSDLLAVLDDQAEALRRYRFAGDWHVYLHLARRGRVSYVARPLNAHRRHGLGATFTRTPEDHVAEIAMVHDEVNRLFALPEGVAASQADYRHRVAARLGADRGAKEAR